MAIIPQNMKEPKARKLLQKLLTAYLGGPDVIAMTLKSLEGESVRTIAQDFGRKRSTAGRMIKKGKTRLRSLKLIK